MKNETTIKEKPILCTPAMAQAVHDGRKTQTRRVCKVQPEKRPWQPFNLWSAEVRTGPFSRQLYQWNDVPHPEFVATCPYGVPGDRLYVREAACKTDGGWVYRGAVNALYGGRVDADSEQARKELGYRWTPNIHVPRAACRSVVEVVSVRVERVESITEADAIAEGFEPELCTREDTESCTPGTPERELAEILEGGHLTAKFFFLDTFYRINKRAPEGSNPWVWVVEFKKLGGA